MIYRHRVPSIIWSALKRIAAYEGLFILPRQAAAPQVHW
jgi:hypothetical protein